MAILSVFFFVGSLLDYFFNTQYYLNEIEDWKLWLYGSSQYKETTRIHNIYDRNNLLIGEYTPVRITYIPMQRCKNLNWLNKATVVSEDESFYEHKGYSIKSMIRAFFVNLIHLSFKQGGGTITQQLARNLFTGHEKKITRKILETILAIKIEKIFKKDEILCLYLNKVYMGEDRFGAEEASWFYFNKSPENLTAAEASMIVGILPSPSRYSPIKNVEGALTKQKIVLTKLKEKKYLTEKQVEQEIAKFRSQYLEEKNGEIIKNKIGFYGASKSFRYNRAPVINEYVRFFLEENFPRDVLIKQNLNIYTSIDLPAQDIALETVRQNVEEFRNNNKELYRKQNLNPEINQTLESVLVSLDIPSGHVKAMVGGFHVSEGKMLTNRIFEIKRQPGSIIKGFLYALALERGIYKFNDTVVDEPISIGGYQPKNWYNDFKGEMTLRKAIAMSVNTIAVKTLNEMGIDYFRDELSQALGISYFTGKQRFPKNLTLALGSAELTPMEITLLYSAILNQGYKIVPIIVKRVENSEGVVLYEDMTVQKDVAIVGPEAASKTIFLLTGVLDQEEDGTASWVGKMRSQNPDLLPYDIAGKSGTAQFPNELKSRYNYFAGIKDSWFVGMNPINVTLVWLGNDQNAPFQGNAVKIWFSYFSNTFKEKIDKRFPNIEEYMIKNSSNDFSD